MAENDAAWNDRIRQLAQEVARLRARRNDLGQECPPELQQAATNFMTELQQQVAAREEADNRLYQQMFPAELQRGRPDTNALAKATRLLKKFLTPEQWSEYKATGAITVINGRKKYKIGRNLLVMVYDVDDYRLAPPRETWCVSLPGTPFADTLLAQLLLLKSDPAKLRKMACVTGRHRREGYARALGLIRRAGYAT